MSKSIQYLTVILILLASIFLRLHNYTEYPQRGATSDEYTYAFLGTSLLTKGVPISWSMFSPYEKREDLTIDGIYFPIVEPYFDHPPLHGLLVGGWAITNGQKEFTQIKLATIRIVPIVLATISGLLLFLLAQRLFGYKIAIWSLLVFSSVPIFVMNMRVVFAENLLTVFLLGGLLLYQRNEILITKKVAVILGILAGLALLTKMAGIIVFLVIAVFLAIDKVNKKQLLLFSLTFLVSFIFLLLYSWYYDWSLFWAIQAVQGTRPIGPQTLLNLLRNPVVVNKVYQDGWYYLGFIALFISWIDYKKYLYIAVPSFIYLLLLIITLNREGLSGWYMIPLFPLMSIAIAKILSDSIEEKKLLFFLFPLFVGLFQIEQIYETAFGLSQSAFRTLLFLFIGIPLIPFAFDKRKMFAVVGQVVFYLFIIGNIYLSWNYIHPA